MTNREYLSTLSNYDLARIIIEDLPVIWRGYNHSILGLTDWLEQEHYISSGVIVRGDGYVETRRKQNDN